MGYKKARIYFLSGTGNSYRVAVWLHEACLERNIDSEIIPIDIAKPKEEIEASSDTLVVMTYPTHGFMPPWSAIKFIFKMPFKKGAHFFCMPTRGSFYLGPLLIPGIAGIASFLTTIILPLKGYNVRGSLSLDMPANFILIHSRLSDKNIRRIKDRAKRKGNRHFQKLLSGKSIWFTLNNLWEYFWGILLLVYYPLFPIAYLLIGRFFMGKMMFVNNECIACEACVKSCPNEAVVMKGRKKSRPYWRYNCEDCLRCMNYCQQKAIEIGHSWAVILYFIGTFSVSAYLFNYTATYFPQIDLIRNWWTLEIVNCVYYYPAYIVAYFIFFCLIQIKPINTLFTYTTFTRLFRRYHEPETSLKDLLNRRV